MIKIIVSEKASPIDPKGATDLDHSSAVRVINCDRKRDQSIHVISSREAGHDRFITLFPGESVVLKKQLTDKVYASSKSVRIAGVSIY